ncbi:hypothetical protein Y032_0079g1277 [Ancylostoma ceylanicum]|uniref:Uncharacterized protein n=1 Tax=Ancylostoma ceylanicum TaxID=53326 RepID=A0A016TSF1_9BILA|nr:hypothetical protein Y032_0079g1277 [Ancylostoma ceylanicum]
MEQVQNEAERVKVEKPRKPHHPPSLVQFGSKQYGFASTGAHANFLANRQKPRKIRAMPETQRNRRDEKRTLGGDARHTAEATGNEAPESSRPSNAMLHAAMAWN